MTATREHDGEIEFATPGVPGYVVMFLVASVVAPVLLLVATAVGDGFSLDLLVYFVPGVFFAALYGAPVALVTTVVGYLALRGVWQQAVHVLVFGVVAGLLGIVLFGVLGDGWEAAAVYFGLAAGVSAAAGRLAVSGRRWRTRLLDSAVPSLR